jgi:hypothetical protein
MNTFFISLFLLLQISFTSNYSSKECKVKSNLEYNCDSIPEVNNEVIKYVETKIHKKINRGECWDLAADALNSVGAKWDGKYKFGKEINVKEDCVFPGDIIQFEKVKLKYEKDGVKYTEDMAHHTAIIYRVKSQGVFELAHQNTGFSGRKVGISDIDLKNITKGKYTIYRPIR